MPTSATIPDSSPDGITLLARSPVCTHIGSMCKNLELHKRHHRKDELAKKSTSKKVPRKNK
jgi:hypothetical protein